MDIRNGPVENQAKENFDKACAYALRGVCGYDAVRSKYPSISKLENLQRMWEAAKSPGKGPCVWPTVAELNGPEGCSKLQS